MPREDGGFWHLLLGLDFGMNSGTNCPFSGAQPASSWAPTSHSPAPSDLLLQLPLPAGPGPAVRLCLQRGGLPAWTSPRTYISSRFAGVDDGPFGMTLNCLPSVVFRQLAGRWGGRKGDGGPGEGEEGGGRPHQHGGLSQAAPPESRTDGREVSRSIIWK